MCVESHTLTFNNPCYFIRVAELMSPNRRDLISIIRMLFYQGEVKNINSKMKDDEFFTNTVLILGV